MGHTVLGPLAFWEGFEQELVTLAFYAVGLALYTLFVGTFYRTLSRRNLFSERKEMMRAPGPLRFLVMFPIVSFAFFVLLSIALFFLVKAPEDIDAAARGVQVVQILTTSMAIVAGVRVAAYISTSASEDLAKLLPLGLLGVVIVDPGFLKPGESVERIQSLPIHQDLVLAFFLAVVVMEVLLRVGWLASGGPARAAKRQEQERSRARLEERRARARAGATPGNITGPGVVAPSSERPPIPLGRGKGPVWLDEADR